MSRAGTCGTLGGSGNRCVRVMLMALECCAVSSFSREGTVSGVCLQRRALATQLLHQWHSDALGSPLISLQKGMQDFADAFCYFAKIRITV